MVLEVGGRVVEDASWLRKKDDTAHINVAELDAVVRGINLALKWKLSKVVLATDSATVYGWLTSTLTGSHRIRTSGIAEMLVRRRLSMVDDLKKEYGLAITVELVKSADNKADALTRVPQTWLQHGGRRSLTELHQRHRFGVERMLYLA